MKAKPKTALDNVVRIIFVVLLALLLLFPGVNFFVVLVFIPVLTWYVWSLQDKVRALEEKLTDKKPAQP